MMAPEAVARPIRFRGGARLTITMALRVRAARSRSGVRPSIRAARRFGGILRPAVLRSAGSRRAFTGFCAGTRIVRGVRAELGMDAWSRCGPMQ
jgi:hypothetical protein